MKEPNTPNPLREHIFQKMREKDTEELIEIWQKNDDETWTPDALEAVEIILLERLGKLPEREQPDEESVTENQEAITFPQDQKLQWVADLSNRLSWVILFVATIYAVLRIINYFVVYVDLPSSAIEIIFNTILSIANVIADLLYAGFAFLVLQAVTEIIYLLIDIRAISLPVIPENPFVE